MPRRCPPMSTFKKQKSMYPCLFFEAFFELGGNHLLFWKYIFVSNNLELWTCIGEIKIGWTDTPFCFICFIKTFFQLFKNTPADDYAHKRHSWFSWFFSLFKSVPFSDCNLAHCSTYACKNRFNQAWTKFTFAGLCQLSLKMLCDKNSYFYC